jgi:hypothetical protein
LIDGFAAADGLIEGLVDGFLDTGALVEDVLCLGLGVRTWAVGFKVGLIDFDGCVVRVQLGAADLGELEEDFPGIFVGEREGNFEEVLEGFEEPIADWALSEIVVGDNDGSLER